MADDRVQMTLSSQLGQIPPILFQRLIGGFRILEGDSLSTTNARKGPENGVPVNTVASQQITRPPYPGQGQQDVFSADIVILHPAGFLFRLGQCIGRLLGWRRLGRGSMKT